MKVSEVIDSNFLEHGDLDSRDVTVTIASVAAPKSVSRADGTKIDKPILYFERAKKGFILNKTNMRLIRMMHGNDMDKWPGREITLYPTTTKMAKGAAMQVGCVIIKDHGKMVEVPCVRVRVSLGEDEA